MTVKRLIEIANQKKSGSSDDPYAAPEFANPDLRDALTAVAGERGSGISGRELGKWLGKNKGRIVNNLRFEHGTEMAHGSVMRWRVAQSTYPQSGWIGWMILLAPYEFSDSVNLMISDSFHA